MPESTKGEGVFVVACLPWVVFFQHECWEGVESTRHWNTHSIERRRDTHSGVRMEMLVDSLYFVDGHR